MTIVGILSDTHGELPAKAFEALAECDYLIHAGDIGGPDILAQLESLAPTTAVLGNNDFDEYGSRVERFAHPVIDGVRFLVAHYPRDVRIGFNGCAALSAGDPIPDVCVHGHTHVPALVMGKEARPASYLICPGSTSRPRGEAGRTIARLLLDEGRVRAAVIEEVSTGNVVFEAGESDMLRLS